MLAFIQDTSERLANLRSKSSEKTDRKVENSEPVSSKVTSGDAQNLDFHGTTLVRLRVNFWKLPYSAKFSRV